MNWRAGSRPLHIAGRVHRRQRRRRGPKVYSLPTREVECIGKGKAHNPYEFGVKVSVKVYTSGQKRGVTEQIKRDLRRRAAVEPVIGHLKAEHRRGRNYLAHQAGDAVNAVLAAAGYNFRLLLKWIAFFGSRSWPPSWQPPPLKIGRQPPDQPSSRTTM